MDDARIKQLTDEVLSQIRGTQTSTAPADLEQRVAALEAMVRDLQGGRVVLASTPGATAIAVSHTHPSLQLLSVDGGSDRCLLEPDKPCVQSGQCQAMGH